MAIPKNIENFIAKALEYIDENGEPSRNQSKEYDLVAQNGKRYPPKYVIAVADHLANQTAGINTKNFSAQEAVYYLQKRGFVIEDKQEENTGRQINQYSAMLKNAGNLIFRGAPGTGKTYLAKQIAAYIISHGATTDYDKLSSEQKTQMEFVQFHPSYDYSDFVEGLRPKVSEDGTMGFELKDGIFKAFVDRARKNYEDYNKDQATWDKETSVQEAITEFFSDILSGDDIGTHKLKTITGTEFIITEADEKSVCISIPENDRVNKLTLNLDKIKDMLKSENTFQKVKDVTNFFGTTALIQHSYYFAIYKAIKDKMRSVSPVKAQKEDLKDYVFIIDEVNRGEISKIFGELFFAIDPGYRGKLGEVSTQYANMHSDPEAKFYIPENVYIIGTMNDIDRSVESFDFAMRRRFRFVEIKANEQTEMLSSLEDKAEEARRRMINLNNEIANVEDLNENYQIGAAYFLKLKSLDYDKLWTDYLQPLLQEYIQGMPDEKVLMAKFKKAYDLQEVDEGDIDETSEIQG